MLYSSLTSFKYTHFCCINIFHFRIDIPLLNENNQVENPIKPKEVVELRNIAFFKWE